MRARWIYFLFLTLIGASLSASAQQEQAPSAQGAEKQTENVNLPVSTENWNLISDIKTGLNPRSPSLIQSDEQPEFVRDLFRLQWRDGDPIDVWLIHPKVAGKIPAKSPVIVYLYNFNDKGERFRDNDWCKRAAADGYAAVGFVSALTDYRFKNHGLSKWFVSELAESLGSTTHDVQLILNFLAQRGDIDMSRVGMFGLGSGATIAILSAQADFRISALDVIDPWGDWPDWFANSVIVPPNERPNYESKEFLYRAATLDPIAYFATLRTRSVRLQQMLSDPVTPPLAKERISAAAPFRATTVKYQNTQDLFKSWQSAGLAGWIKQQLQSEPSPGAGDAHHAKKK